MTTKDSSSMRVRRGSPLIMLLALLMPVFLGSMTSPAKALGPVDLSGYTLSSYGGAQDAGCGATEAAIEGTGNETLRLTGNCWKQIDLAYTVTPNTVLEFDFSSTIEGEIHGIGFDDDDVIDNPIRIFQLSGTQAYGDQTYTYATGSGTVHYTIPVGTSFTGAFTALTFVNDADAGPLGDSVFSNIELNEVTAPPPPSLIVNGNGYPIQSYGGTQDNGTAAVSIEDSGLTLRIVGNGWKKVSIPYTVTTDTVVEFDFSSGAQGEIHGIGFDVDDTIDNPIRIFQLFGTQTYGNQTYRNYASGSGSIHYSIPVGTFYTGSFTSLTFTNDHDVTAATGESVFSNILIHETQLAPTITFDPAPAANYPGSDFTVNATTDSNGALTYSYVSGPCALIDADLGTFSPTGIGSCVVQADTAWTPTFLAGSAQQTVTIGAAQLYAVAGTTTLGTQSVNVWGYNTTGDPVTQPGGPTLVVNEGDPVTIVLHNQLGEDTGLLLGGQAMIPDTVGVAGGSTKEYTFTATRPGTYLYSAGLLPNAQHQVAMGLYGALIVRPAAAGQAYADPITAYDDEAVLVLSEIDPALNNRANPATFDMRKFKPRYFLINGQVYPNTADIPTAAGNRVLLRYLNAGTQFHSMELLGTHQNLIANDGSPYTYSHEVVAETFGPGQTMDAIVTVPAAAVDGSKFAIFDGNLMLHNSNLQGFGGMMTFVSVSGTPSTDDTTGPVTSNVAYSAGTLTATVDDTTTGGADIAGAEYFLDGVEVGTAMSAVDGAFDSPSEAVTAAVSVPPGPHTLYVRGQDALGNWGVVSSVLVNGGDATGPASTGLTLTPNPSNGSVDVAVHATGNDSASGGSNIAAAEYFINSTGTDGSGTPMAVNAAAPIASLNATILAADMVGVPEGTNVVYVHSQDSFGNWGGFSSIDLIVDRTGPTTSNVGAAPNPNNGQIGVNSTIPVVRVTASFTDTVSKLGAAEGFIDSEGANGTGFVITATDGVFNSLTETGYADIPLTTINQLSAGAHTIYVHAKDAVGNWGPSSTTVLVIDKTAPSVGAVSVTPTPVVAAGSVTLSATATDAASAITRAEWFTGADPGVGNGTAMTVSGTGPWSLSAAIDVSTWANGNYTLNVRARDAAGNWSTTGSTVLVVNIPPPPFPGLYFSTSGNTAVPGVGGTADNADIYLRNATAYSRVIDAAGGGSLGLPGGANVDGFDRVDDTHFYMSFSGTNTTVPGLGAVQDEDVVYYNAGVWSVYFDGTAQGLTNGGQDLDAITIAGGVLYFSTVGGGNANSVPGVAGPYDDADIYSWNGASFARVWDASANGLPGGADVDGLTLVDGTHFYLSFNSTSTNVPGLGGVADVNVVYNNAGTWSTYFDGVANSLVAGTGHDIDGFDLP